MHSAPPDLSPAPVSPNTAYAIVGVSMLLYVVLFYPLYALSGSYLETGAAPLSALPVVAAGLTMGVRPALAIGLVTIVINTVLLSIIDTPSVFAIVDHGGVPAAIATLLGGGAAGKMHVLYVQSRLLVAEKTALVAEKEAVAAHWRWLLDNAPAIVLHVDRDGVIQYANQALEGLSGGFEGNPVFDYLVPESATELRKLIGEAFHQEKSAEFDIAMDDPDQPFWYSGALGPVKQNGVVTRVALIGVETTTRKLGEEALVATADTERKRAEDMEALLRIATTLMMAVPFKLKMQAMLAEVVERAEASLANFRVPDASGEGLRMVASAGPANDTIERPEVTPLTGFAGRAFKLGQAYVTSTESDRALPHSLSDQGVRSVASVPVLLGGRPFGVITVHSLDPDHFTPERLRFLTALCGGLGMLIANANAAENAEAA